MQVLCRGKLRGARPRRLATEPTIVAKTGPISRCETAESRVLAMEKARTSVQPLRLNSGQESTYSRDTGEGENYRAKPAAAVTVMVTSALQTASQMLVGVACPDRAAMKAATPQTVKLVSIKARVT